MGFFKSKKGPSRPSSSRSDATLVPAVPDIRLTVALDPPPTNRADGGVFEIAIPPSEGVAGIRRRLAAHLGEVAMSLFKVSVVNTARRTLMCQVDIPVEAHAQARSYARRFLLLVDLINHFPSYNLDDRSQLTTSLGRTSSPITGELEPCVRDWWPNFAGSSDISVLCRRLAGQPSTVIPTTLFVHFAPKDPVVTRGSRPTTSDRERERNAITAAVRPPAVVEILPSTSIIELKMAALEADGRPSGFFDKVTAWRVDMSHHEIVVIQERGGLKAGRMPWPYPPCAPVPVKLEDDSAPVSQYFPSFFAQPGTVNLSIWLHPSIYDKLGPIIPEEGANAPPFSYPLPPELVLPPAQPSVDEHQRRLTATLAPPSCPSLSQATHHADPQPRNMLHHSSTAPNTRGRSRPSTAPASVTEFGSKRPVSALSHSGLRAQAVMYSTETRMSSKSRSPSPTGTDMSSFLLSPASPSMSMVGKVPRASISSTSTGEQHADSILAVPSLSFSRMSIASEKVITPVQTPMEELQVFYEVGADKGARFEAQRRAVLESLYGTSTSPPA